MSKIEKILVVIDPEEDFSEAVDGLPIELTKALRFVADKQAAEITLLSVSYEKYLNHSFHSIGYDYMMMRQKYLLSMREKMQRIVTILSERGYQVTSDVVWAHPRYEQIVEKAQEIGADLVVQHCRAHAKIEHYQLTNDSWQLVRHCPLPLLLVKDADWPEKPTMMAAVDPVHSHHKPLRLDYAIMDIAGTAKEQLGADLHIVHAFAESARPFAPAGEIEAEHRAAFEDLLSDYDFPEESLHLLDETPTYALQHYGEKIGSDIVVMGAISRSRLSDALIGNTAEQVLDYLKTDVLIIKPVVAE
jgi:universal stress protein E